jgi:hypothetical protein
MKKVFLVCTVVIASMTSCKKEETNSATPSVVAIDERDKLIGNYAGTIESVVSYSVEDPTDYSLSDSIVNENPKNIQLKATKLNSKDLTFTITNNENVKDEVKINTSQIVKSPEGYLFKINNFKVGETEYIGQDIESTGYHGYIINNEIMILANYKDFTPYGNVKSYKVLLNISCSKI